MNKIDEGLVKVIRKQFDKGGQWWSDPENLALAIQSYLKKEGWAKLPGKYVVKKGCLVKID